ncbi:MAG: hypothetical protein OXI04_00970 [Bacteroidota bacterium]|nr:hypothetical protein [Bacteroidota bacterium]
MSLVSLLTGCAWGVPAVSSLAPNHQYPAYADVSSDDTTTPDMFIRRNSALYEAIHTHTQPPFIASEGEIPPRLRVAYRITAARNDKTSTGVTTHARCEIFSPCPERIGNGRAVASVGTNAAQRLGDDRTAQLVLIRSGLENPLLTSEKLWIRRFDNPEAAESSYSPTRSRVELNAGEAVKGTRTVRNEKAVIEPNPYGGEALQRTSELAEGGIIHDSDITVSPAGARTNLYMTNEGVVRQGAQHHCTATDVDHCIPGFFMARNLAQGKGSSSQDIDEGTNGREETDLSAAPITPEHIHMDWGLSVDSSVSLTGDTTDSQISKAFSSVRVGLPSQVAESGIAHLNDVEIVLDPNADVFYMLEEFNPIRTINVKLSAQPVNDVTVTISGQVVTKLRLNKTMLTFTNSNWDDNQPVELTAVDDADFFDEEIKLTFSGSGTAPDIITGNSITVIIQDDENVYTRISPSTSADSPHTVTEGGSVTFTFTQLQAYGSPVTVRLGDRVVPYLGAGQARCFQIDDINDSETVTLTIGDDSDALDETLSLPLIAGLDDPNRICNPSGISLPYTTALTIWLKIDDDEEIKLLVVPNSITVIEGDQVGETFSVSLDQQPRNSVTVDIRQEPGSDLNLNKTQLLFTNANSQEVKVTANEDTDDLTDEMETLTLVGRGDDFGGVVDTTVTVTIKDDDLNLSAAPSEITVVEGGSKTFTVSLSHRESEEVIVEIVSSDGSSSELQFDSPLTFFPGTKTRTVTVRADSDDDDETGEMETLTLTATGGVYEGMTATVTVTITDDDLELVVNPKALTLNEGGPDGTFDVSLSHTPASSVTVSIATHTNSSLGLSDTELTFDAANTPQTVSVTPLADNNSLDETETITLRADDNFARKTASVRVTIIDAEDPDLVIDPTAITMSEGGSEKFTVELSERPLEDVTVDITGASGSDLTLEPASMTFTTSNWDDTQEVKVTAGHDDDVEDDKVTLTLRASGGGYSGVRDNVTVTIEDDDTASLVIDPTELEIPEEESRTFTVNLSHPSSSSVRVNITPRAGAELSVNPSVLTFTAGDSETPQTVTVTADPDDDAFDDHEKLDLTAFGPGYDGVVDSIDVTILDNETLSLEIDPDVISVIEGEDGTFEVSLSERPLGDVTVNTGPAEELTVTPEELNFPQDEWDSPQVVTVTANEDEDDQIEEVKELTLKAENGGYDGVEGTVTVIVTDDDFGLQVAPSEITVVEGESEFFTVNLPTSTSGEVAVDIVSSRSPSELEFPGQLTFTQNTESQAVTVTAIQDTDDETGEIETLTLTVRGGPYDGMTATVTVTITDDDLELRAIPTEITVTEGDPTGALFEVSLSHTPASTVTVSIATETDSNLELSDTDLTFTAAETPQTVTVTAGEDDNALDETETLTLTADGDYDAQTALVTVNIIDAQEPELVVVPSAISIPEGEGETFTVELSEQPQEDVTVDISGASGSDLTLDQISLTFTIDDWDDSQVVNITAVHDDDAEDEVETLTLTASGGGYDGVSNIVTVTIEDDDTASLIIDPKELEIQEDESETFTVSLLTPPSSSVTVDITPRAGAELDVDPSSLTFTAEDSDIPQTVTVTAEDDLDAFDDHEKLDLTAFGAGYDGVEDSVAVTIIDDETLSLIIFPDTIDVNEGDEAAFSVILSERPLGDVTVNTGFDAELTLDPAALNFPQDEWNSEQLVTVFADHDEDSQTGEVKTLILVAENGGYDNTTDTLTVIVADDDLSLVVQPEITIIEGTTESVPVELSHTPLAPVTVNLVRISPVNPDDSELILDGESLTFTAGNIPQTIPITAKADDDVFDEHEETLQFIASGGGYDGIESDLLVYIENPDPPRLIIDPGTINLEEGNEEGEIFTVKLSHEPLESVTVDISGHSDTDLEWDPAALMFTTENWNDADTVTVNAKDDPDDEDETEELTLTAAGGGYTGKEGSVLVNIDDDESFQLRVTGESVRENEGPLTFTVTLETPNPAQVTRVRYETMDGSAVASLDYRERSDVLEFGIGETTKTVDVEIIDDFDSEQEESFMLVLSEPENARLVVESAAGVILDDDVPANVNLESATQEVREGDGVRSFGVTLDGAPASGTVLVTFSVTQGSALPGQDYRVQTVGPLRFPPGTRNQSIDIEIVDDEIQEPSETFTIELTNVENADLGLGASTVTIVDDDEASLSINDVRAKESSGEAVFTVSLSNTSTTEITVNYSTEDGTALAGLDYTSVEGTLSFSANDANLTRTIRVPLVDNNVDEPDETFLVRLSGVVGAVIADNEGIGTIEDDEPPISVSIYDGRAREDAGSLEMAARLNRPSLQNVVTVRFSSSDRTATSSSDYTATTGLLIFERGSTEGKVLVEVIDDQLVEGDETFEVTLSIPRNAVIDQGLATGTIVENEGTPQLLIPDISVLESAGVAVFAMTLSTPSAVPVIVNYETEDGTAEAGTDYVHTAGTLSFAPGEVKKEIRVEILQDDQDWRSETFSLILAQVLNAKLSSTRVEATIAEETTVEEGALNAYVSRMLRTTASHVVEAIVDRYQRVPECRLPNLSFLRYGYPNWRPSAGELLSGCGAQATQGGWSVWGRGTFTRVLGREGALSIRSNVTTMAVGTDYQWTNRLLTGLLTAHSIGNGSYEAYDESGEASSALTGVYPYLSYQLPTVRVWLLAGLGRGNAKAESQETTLTSGLVALGATGTLVSGSRVHFNYAADAFTASANPARFSTINVQRLRASVTGSVSIHQWARPYLEAAIRHDAGDAETGLGLELGGGARLAHPKNWLRGEVSIRRMIMHTSDGFQQWGASASIQYGNPEGLGPSAQVRPIWGQATRRDFWSHYALTSLARESGAGRMDIELGYGTRSSEKSLVRPSLGTTLHSQGRDYRVGYNISMTNGLVLSVITTARESTTYRQPLTYGISARASLQW